jgi:hypothetical protein
VAKTVMTLVDKRRVLSAALAILCMEAIACRHSTPERWIIPAGHVGWLRLDYSVKGAPPLPLEHGRYLVRVPLSGRMATSTVNDPPVDNNEYYIQDSGASINYISDGRQFRATPFRTPMGKEMSVLRLMSLRGFVSTLSSNVYSLGLVPTFLPTAGTAALGLTAIRSRRNFPRDQYCPTRRHQQSRGPSEEPFWILSGTQKACPTRQLPWSDNLPDAVSV